MSCKNMMDKFSDTNNNYKNFFNKKFVKFCLLVTPFIDDILHLLTIYLFKPYFKLEPYPHYPNTFYKIFKKLIVDIIALSGMLLSVVIKSHNNIKNGLIYSLLHITLSFIVPLLFIPELLKISKLLFENKNYLNISNLILGFLFISLLIYIIEVIYEKATSKEEEED